MIKNEAEIKFDKARKRLSDALQNLEKITKEKIKQATFQSKIIDLGKNDKSSLQSKIVEQSSLIENLNFEINNLQKTVADLGGEIEFLNEKNKILTTKIAEFHIQKSKLLDAVEAEIAAIEELLK